MTIMSIFKGILIRCAKCQWHLAHQILLFKLHEVFYMFYNFRTCYSTVSNMRRYGHKCHFRKIVFYSTFSLSSQYLIQCFLSLLNVFSLSDLCSLPLSSSDHLPHPQNKSTAASSIKPSITNHPPSPSHCSTYAIIQRYAIVLHLCLAFSSPISGLWVCADGWCGFVPMDDVGLGCGFVWFGKCGFLLISLVVFLFCFFFFFFRWRWWMWVCASGGCRCCCGNGCWWPLLQ